MVFLKTHIITRDVLRTSPHVPSPRFLGSRRREIHNKTPLISSVPLYGVPADVGPELHDLRDDVGGQARAAVQDVRERRAMLSLVRANAAGLKYRFKVITLVRMSFVDRCSSMLLLVAAVRDREGPDDDLASLTVDSKLYIKRGAPWPAGEPPGASEDVRRKGHPADKTRLGGGGSVLRRRCRADPRVDLAPQSRHPRARPARGLEEKGERLRRGRVGPPARDGVGVGRRFGRGSYGEDSAAIRHDNKN